MDDFIYFAVHGDFLVVFLFVGMPVIWFISMCAAYGLDCWRDEREYKKMRKNDEV